MTASDPFDFWYAVHNTAVLISPAGRLETFGATVVDYTLVCEVMDRVDQVRIRWGRLHAERPEIVTLDGGDDRLEGFQQAAAARYLDWLKQHRKELLILKYGFRLRRDAVREEIITDRLDAVLDRVGRDVRARANPLAALVRGVDEPWEVCLVKLAADLVQRSSPHHMRELRADPSGVLHTIEQAFSEAERDHRRLGALADLLKAEGVFNEYQDRFFALVHRESR
jgi:hypothetical protein